MLLAALALLALAGSSDYPAEWGRIADLSPEGIAKSARRCLAEGDCERQDREIRQILADAWNSSATTLSDRMLMLKAIEMNTDASGTDWNGVRVNYFGMRTLATWADGRSIRPVSNPPAQSTSVSTRCYAYISRSGRSIYSECTSSGR